MIVINLNKKRASESENNMRLLGRRSASGGGDGRGRGTPTVIGVEGLLTVGYHLLGQEFPMCGGGS